MTDQPGPHGSALHGRRLRVFVGSLTTAAALMVAAVLVSLTTASTSGLVAPTPSTLRDPHVAATSVPPGFQPPASAVATRHLPPVELAVPAIGVRSRLTRLHLNADGTLQVPTDYGLAGWFSDGSYPGDSGPPAVIVGHVDSKAGPGVFYRLSELRTGDVVLIRRADGADLRFRVYRTAVYPKKAFPAHTVYAAEPGPELRLITCTGVFDATTGHYLSNLVVYARLFPALSSGPHR